MIKIWWISTVIIPLLPALIALFLGIFYVSIPKALHGSIGQGQLYFVTVGISMTATRIARGEDANSEWIRAVLFGIILVSVVMYTAAVIWKYQEAPKADLANAFTLFGSIALLIFTVYYASAMLAQPIM